MSLIHFLVIGATCLIFYTNSQHTIYTPLIDTSVSGSVFDIDYSPDQKYIAIAKSS